MTFIAVARSHSKAENSARSLENARKALAEIQRTLISPIGLSEDEVKFLKHRYMEIESALWAFGPATHHEP
jgi:hypothetical protein